LPYVTLLLGPALLLFVVSLGTKDVFSHVATRDQKKNAFRFSLAVHAAHDQATYANLYLSAKVSAYIARAFDSESWTVKTNATKDLWKYLPPRESDITMLHAWVFQKNITYLYNVLTWNSGTYLLDVALAIT
jgi:hypothetical protein